MLDDHGVISCSNKFKKEHTLNYNTLTEWITVRSKNPVR